MALPAELVLVRHGQSEGNVVNKSYRKGEPIELPETYLEKETHAWRLSELGISQAQSAGAWIRENIGGDFDRYFTSYFTRAIETAGHLALPKARWMLNPFIHERRLGLLSGLSPDEYMNRREAEGRDKDPLFWKPPGGESILDLSFRFDRVLQSLHREAEDGKAVLVAHGDLMTAGRFYLEHMAEKTFDEWVASREPTVNIHNGQVMHYTRRTDPENPDAPLSPDMQFRRSVCPWELDRSTNTWEKIVHPKYTNEEMLEHVEYHPRVIDAEFLP